ncbi:hypothetical protein [Bathymodiolus japonicus methanotrophic gill symbiont]|uniref:hypothetical protein n=1 Tax=Bathymodiolus japonicus methanotrophic gill symbiont TaxID=113269 RepID=UPI001C8F0CDF|nr:hypothetical protein [Bathymodiolus japonicus methanotrophic gill symbiont]
MAFYFVSTFANAQTPTKQRPYGYRGLKIFTSLRLRFPDFQRRGELVSPFQISAASLPKRLWIRILKGFAPNTAAPL